jgi:hypothetical protein
MKNPPNRILTLAMTLKEARALLDHLGGASAADTTLAILYDRLKLRIQEKESRHG